MESFALKIKNFYFCDVLDVLIGRSRADLKFFHSHRSMVKFPFFFFFSFFWAGFDLSHSSFHFSVDNYL